MKKVVEYEINNSGDCKNCKALFVNYYFGCCCAFKKIIEIGYNDFQQCHDCKSYILEHQNAEDV